MRGRGFEDWLETELATLALADRLRACPELSGSSRVRPGSASGALTSFCSNDYLGLAAHPALAAAAARAAREEGFGASAARLVAGDLPAHRGLEADLAAFTGRPAALLFPTGYQTNLGVIAALAGPGDLVVSDAANHASIIDGCRLSRAGVAVYRHADAAEARAALARGEGARRRFLVTESLFSMDGDVAPLAALAEAAEAHDAVLVVDEAHALGALGPGGRGLCAAAGVVPDVLVGTLGKALGAAGGFAAGEEALRRFLVNRARTFIYTTALPPPVAAAARAALEIAAGPEGTDRRARLKANTERLGGRLARAGLLPHPPRGPIVPVVLGAEARAIAAAEALRARGIFVPAIRPPTVAPGTSRLRVTLSSAHEDAAVDLLAAALVEAAG
jgi:8-amino-7-oxononanoate synthase